ncbi:carbohydrate ABC transporter permease [Paenibacillus aceris]|uniref:Raffinose/stachyose/melibiose transport system permease protein n=1 Tax=Paenibacillus aceris TaxID=869555 RepID=A0ABS4I3K6_9BACL|nr:carbohydrate ABC transporter permease [Paenibacillus aceris]MBP1965506.1 raffinose/stachyose/melibiose transport system permease protein [Paenibacillus aceris]NHW33445.1 carbohydrate ABC transporter permease [Paenibacillus aceris]
MKIRGLAGVLFAAFMTVLVLAELFPLVWLFDFSLLKSGDFFGSSILKWPNPPMWKNYGDAFKGAHITMLFMNSLLVAFFSIVLIVGLSVTMGYAFTRMQWRLRNMSFALIMVGMIIPIYSTLLPNFILFKQAGILNTYLSLILPYAAFAIPVSMFIITGFLETVPRALEEAAIMDGLGVPGMIYRIILPLLKPAIATVAVLAFLSCWNEFIMAVTYIDKDSLRTLPFAVVYFMGQYSSNYGAQFAVLAIIAIPSILIYLLFTDQITRGVTAGAVKG